MVSPCSRPDIYEIAHRAKEMGFYTALSTNGTLIDESNIEKIAAVGFDYLGISFDGIAETHDSFRRKEGAFDASMIGSVSAVIRVSKWVCVSP